MTEGARPMTTETEKAKLIADAQAAAKRAAYEVGQPQGESQSQPKAGAQPSGEAQTVEDSSQAQPGSEAAPVGLTHAQLMTLVHAAANDNAEGNMVVESVKTWPVEQQKRFYAAVITLTNVWREAADEREAAEAAEGESQAQPQPQAFVVPLIPSVQTIEERAKQDLGKITQGLEKQAKQSQAKAKIDTGGFLDAPINGPSPNRLSERQWSEIVTPKAGELEQLTHVPGVVGDIVEWIISGARRPNRMMALGVALVTVGTIVGHAVAGPTDSASHLFLIMLAPTGYGKDWPLQCGTRIFDAIGMADRLGPSEWVSGRGMLKRMQKGGVMVCFMDEFGDQLAMANSKQSIWVSDIIGILKIAYNSRAVFYTAEKVNEESERIDCPAVSIVGAATPEKFFGALTPEDLESGFANRLGILPFEGHRRPPEQDPPKGADVVPADLIADLKRLPVAGPIDALAGLRPQPIKIDWQDAEARKVYLSLSREMDALEIDNPKQYELGMRVCENAVRLATIMAVGRGAAVVSREDMAWAARLSQQSFEAACGGFDKYMTRFYSFPRMCEEFIKMLEKSDGFLSNTKATQEFRNFQRFGNEFERVTRQLIEENRIAKGKMRTGERGPPTKGWALVHGERVIEKEVEREVNGTRMKVMAEINEPVPVNPGVTIGPW